jgi:excisionase family DNA binding protein
MHTHAQEDSRRLAAAGDPSRDRTRTRFLLVREAAPIMRMDESTLYRHLRADRFPAVKVGGRYLIPEAVVSQMAEEALTTGRCVVVEEWAARWRDQLAANALAHGPGRQPTGGGRPRPGANQTGAGSFSTQHRAGYGEDVTSSARTAHAGGVR